MGLKPGDMRELTAGMGEALPMVASFGIFGAVWGSVAVQVGLSVSESMAMSVLVCAGTTQFAVLPLLAAGAPVWVIVMTTFVTGMPNFLMAASLSQRFAGLSRTRLALLAHGISNSTYALTLARYAEHPTNSWYFVGSVISVYSAWCIGTFVGAVLGEGIPDPKRFGLDFVFPAVFLTIAVRSIRSGRDWAVAVLAAVVALAVAWRFGGSWHVAIGGLGASLIGLWPEPKPSKAAIP